MINQSYIRNILVITILVILYPVCYLPSSLVFTASATENDKSQPKSVDSTVSIISSLSGDITADIDNVVSVVYTQQKNGITPIFDYGDAPDPTYPTLTVSNGARHFLGSNVFLGSCVDAEIDGQPSAIAIGDDAGLGSPVLGTCTGNNDEDGVSFTSDLAAGSIASITIHASAGCNLSGWIDFNQDGDWSDVGEEIFSGYPLTAGNNQLKFMIPVRASIGMTYARFRGTTDGAVSYSGIASNGEVEDYIVNVVPEIDNPEFPWFIMLPGIINQGNQNTSQ